MGTITARKRGAGVRYTAQIRMRRDGAIIHTESETFSKRVLAQEWLRRREAELDQQKARGVKFGKSKTLGDLIDWYIEEVGKLTKWGRSKAADLNRIRSYKIAEARSDRLTSADYIRHAEWRRENGTGPATIGNDLVWIRQVLKSARPALGIPIDLQQLDDAVHSLRERKLVAKSKRRERRITPDEERRLLDYFARRDRRSEIPMVTMMRFALLSARREDEMTRLEWTDLSESKETCWLRDAKHPRDKDGNHKEFRLLAEAAAIIAAQPKIDREQRIFPYNPKSIGAAFTRATRVLEIDDLRFHDLRHEATSRLFERGYSIQEVAQFTLHESWATLQRYTHLKPADVPQREERMPKNVSAPKPARRAK